MEETRTEELDQSSTTEVEGTTQEETSMASQEEGNAEQTQSQAEDVEAGQESDSSLGEGQENESQRNVNAERGKISKLESDNAQFKKERQQLSQAAQAYQVLNQAMAGDPEAYEAMRKAIKKTRGVDIPTYREVYGDISSSSQTGTDQSGQVSQGAAPQQQAQPAGPRPLTESDVFRLMDDKQSTDRFLSKYPDYDPLQVDDAFEREKRFASLQDIRFLAANFKALPKYAGISMDQAYELAHQAMNLGASLKNAQEAGAIGGEQRVLNRNTGAIGGASTSSGAATGEASLAPEDNVVLARLGLNKLPGGKDAYLKHKKGS